MSNNVNPSWSIWNIGDAQEIERSEKVEPPVQNKNEAQNDEMADVKSAIDSSISSYVKPKDVFEADESKVDDTMLRAASYNYEDELIQEDLDKVLDRLQRKTLNIAELTDDEFTIRGFADTGIPNNTNVATSATKTRAMKHVSKHRLEDHREYAKRHIEINNWKINTQRVESQFSFTALQNRKLSSNLAIMFAKIAEERTGDKIEGRHKWDIEKVMFRRVSKKLITQCKYSRDKEKIIILLDSSPSCSKMADLYSQISTEACKYEHVELYDAPNGYIHSKYSISQRAYVPLTDEQLDNVYHWLGFENRTIIYFGDCDATDSISASYEYNEIHWFFQNPYRRYSKEDQEAMMSNLREQWQGKLKLYECNNVNEIVKAVKEMK
tara:strand:+ start:15760 stop:16902 length:1143 start_codon:yes stop_codon:yes gene_type:complete